LVKDARALSSGTLSYLVNSISYAVVDAVQYDFIEFCQENPRYENWVAAWHDFQKIYNFSKVISEKEPRHAV
jgi:hypothetical protein